MILSFCLIYFDSKIESTDSILIYLPYFLIGGLIYYWNVEICYNVATISLLTVVGLILLSHSIPLVRTLLLDRELTYVFLSFSMREVFNFILTIAIIPFIIYNIKRPVENFRKDSLLSSMSFVIYLLHWPLLQLYSFVVQDVSVMVKISFSIVYFVSCIGLSYLLSNFVDKKFEIRRRKWLKKVN